MALALLLGLLGWPVIAGMVAANDDIKFLRGIEFAGSWWEDVRQAWAHQPNFRPLEYAAALLCDERTLEARSVLLIQAAGLVVLLAALRRLLGHVAPRRPIALPLLIIWLALSPATSISLWQMDTCSQTWTVALAAWIGVLVIAAVGAARAGRGMAGAVVALWLLCTAGVTIKEMFYGWSAGIGTALILAIAWLWTREPRAARRSMWLLLPVVVLPAVHLLLRLKWSALGSALAATDPGASDAARYQVSVGANILNNLGLSALGMFSNGPLHQVMNDQAAMIVRLAPLASLVAVFVLLAAAAVLALLHRGGMNTGSRRLLLLASLAGLMSISVTLPMGSVSELYGFGGNIASGLLVVAAMLALWNPAAIEERVICRSIAVVCAIVLLAVGAVGLASRAYHFGLTWGYARNLNRIVLEHQQSLPASEPGAPPARIFVDRRCYSGQMHSQYIVSPVQAISIGDTMDWMNRRDPKRPIIFASMDVPTGRRPGDLVVDCQSWPVRYPW